MNLEQALEQVKKNWAKLPNEVKDGTTIDAVWMAVSDESQPYEVDEEWIGMTSDGELHWTYASGCSCWDGNYTHDHIKDIKTFKFGHDQMQQKWEKAIIKFAESKKIVSIK